MWWTELPFEFRGGQGRGGEACGGRAKDNKGKKTINVSDISFTGGRIKREEYRLEGYTSIGRV